MIAPMRDDIILQRALRTCLKYGPPDWTAERCLQETRRVLREARVRHTMAQARRRPISRGLNGLSAPERLIARAFQDGKKSWITIWPPRGPKMRITHEVLEGLGACRPCRPMAYHR